MRSDQLTAAVNNTPWYVAVFEVTSLPDWLNPNPTDLEIGTRLYWNGGSFATLAGNQYNLGHSYMDFVGYARAQKIGPYFHIKLLEEPHEFVQAD